MFQCRRVTGDALPERVPVRKGSKNGGENKRTLVHDRTFNPVEGGLSFRDGTLMRYM